MISLKHKHNHNTSDGDKKIVGTSITESMIPSVSLELLCLPPVNLELWSPLVSWSCGPLLQAGAVVPSLCEPGSVVPSRKPRALVPTCEPLFHNPLVLGLW